MQLGHHVDKKAAHCPEHAHEDIANLSIRVAGWCQEHPHVVCADRADQLRLLPLY